MRTTNNPFDRFDPFDWLRDYIRLTAGKLPSTALRAGRAGG